jgi:hypothetical protein
MPTENPKETCLPGAVLSPMRAALLDDRLVSFDERHFRAITPLQGGAFTLLPQDA